MTLRPSIFGSTCTVTDAFMRKVAKLGILEATLDLVREREAAQLKKTDGQKPSRLTGIVKLDDANDAGTRRAKNCTLFLTEGLSAKTFAVTNIPVLKNGRDLYGAYPLRGKLLNVRDASVKQKLENQETTELKQILGLQEGKEYTSVDTLRYDRICALVDSDVDRKHIQGLIINWLESSYPRPLKLPGFVLDFVSPIVKCVKGSDTRLFYDAKAYEHWKTEADGGKGWNVKYFKGLGTSKAGDVKQYFADRPRHLKSVQPLQPRDSDRLDTAFSNKRAPDRKEWLKAYDPKNTAFRISSANGAYSIGDFIDHDFIEFSMYDNSKMKNDVKVAQFAGEVAKLTEYRHGEQSLCAFGTHLARMQGHLVTSTLNCDRSRERSFIPNMTLFLITLMRTASRSNRVTVPVIPVILVNGCEGIGTGYSTTVLPYDPKQVVAILKTWAMGKGGDHNNDGQTLKPYYSGFTGQILETGPGKSGTGTLEIDQLPVGTWTESYKAHLEKMIVDDLVKDYKEYHTDTTVRFVVKSTEKLEVIIDTARGEHSSSPKGNDPDDTDVADVLIKVLKLATTKSNLKKYESPYEVLSGFYTVRLASYAKQKNQEYCNVCTDEK
ncbi:DNA topoisomerase [Powellomyces hirtus]|nr:DNA topoisomerase [Powellomyces hirtus]